MLTGPIPEDLCRKHQEVYRAWRDNHYDPDSPREWPAGMSVSAGTDTAERMSQAEDDRRTHAQRAAEFDRENTASMRRVSEACRSGESPGCADDGASVIHDGDDDPHAPGVIERLYLRDGEPWATVRWPSTGGHPAFTDDHPVRTLLVIG